MQPRLSRVLGSGLFPRPSLDRGPPRATPSTQERPIPHKPPGSDTTTTDRTAYWLSIAVQAGIWVGCALFGASMSEGLLRQVFAGAALVALAFTVPGLWSLGSVLAHWRAAALAAQVIADARVGDDGPMGTLLARWSVAQADVDGYLHARERTRRMRATAVIAAIVVVCFMAAIRGVDPARGPSWLVLAWFAASALAVAATVTVWQLAARAAVARAEAAPLAVILCEDGVLFGGDVRWWRGPNRLVSAKMYGVESLELVSTYATLDLKVPSGQGLFANQRQGPSVRFERDVLALPVADGAWAEATAAATALRERHGLAREHDAGMGGDLFGER